MKRTKTLISAALLLAVMLMMMTGCGEHTDEPQDNGDAIGGDMIFQGAGDAEDGDAAPQEADTDFSFSDGLDENGFWLGITALDYVEMFDHSALVIPRGVHDISDDVLQAEIEGILVFFSTSEQVFDRAVQHGDTINIDFVGSVDGVEFAGGSTEGAGTEVTIGVTNFIDDFLYQLIGGMPGDVINVEVTFPDVYHEPSLQGAEALFITTINYIAESRLPELTDDFVAENLAMFAGWTTVSEMSEAVSEQLRERNIRGYIEEFLKFGVTIHSIPVAIIEYQEGSMIESHRMAAQENGMEFEQFLLLAVGVSSVDELIELHRDEMIEQAAFHLVIQAIAEDAGIMVSLDDLANYFMELTGTSDYSMHEELYGLPFLKKIVLAQMVLDYLGENAVLE